MTSLPLHFRNLIEVANMIKRGKATSLEVTIHLLDRIADIDRQLNSYIHVCREHALEQARTADIEITSGIYKGLLHGVPIAVKDLCFTTYAPTRAGTTIYTNFMAPYNATVVDRLECAGAVILGKLSMTEGAYTGHHPTIPIPVNPWNKNYWVGSSSSGSGVATAAGLCFGSLGSDTGGSIRYPCAAGNLTGIKPTNGRVSRYGIFPLAETLDHIGPMARSTADCAAILQVIAGWDAHDPTSIDTAVPEYSADVGKSIRDMRIGIDRSYSLDGTDPQITTALEQAVTLLEGLGARIVDVRMPDYDELVEAWIMMCAIETAVAHKDTYPTHADQYGPSLAQLIDEGHATTGMRAARGHQLRVLFSSALSTMFGDVDCMLCPTIPKLIPSLAKMTDYGSDPKVLHAIMRFTAPFDFSGNPTITLPNGIDTAGMPLSMQIVGPHLGESSIIQAADAYQRVTSWHTRHPKIG
jgi:amidase